MTGIINALVSTFGSIPTSPIIGEATPTGPDSANISFTASTNNGGYPIISYTAISSPGNITATVIQSGSGSIDITGLSPSTDYTFVIYATNSLGNSPNSDISNEITTNNSGSIDSWIAAIGGGGGGGGTVASQAAGGGGGGGVTVSSATLERGQNYCISIGAGGSRGQGTVWASPAYLTGYVATMGGNTYICSPIGAFNMIKGGGGGHGGGAYRQSPSGNCVFYDAGSSDGGGNGAGGGASPARPNGGGSGSGATPYYGGNVQRSPTSGLTSNGTVGGGGGGANGSGQDGCSFGAPLSTSQRAAVNKGGDGGIGLTVFDSGNVYGTFGGGGGGSRSACNIPTTTCVCYYAQPGAGLGGPWGGRGGHLYQASGGVPAQNGTAPGGGGGGGGNAATGTPFFQTAPAVSESPTAPGGRGSGAGGAGQLILSYPSELEALSYISPTLSVSNGPTGTIANGRRYYCFNGGTGIITG